MLEIERSGVWRFLHLIVQLLLGYEGWVGGEREAKSSYFCRLLAFAGHGGCGKVSRWGGRFP